jgi:hypothetical protein
MSHYAKVVNGIVTQVIVAEADFFDTFVDTSPGTWIQTSYNTHGNQHPENRPMRGNYAGIGFTYDATNDVFYAPKPEGDGWTISAPTWIWVNSNLQPVSGSDSVNTNFADVITLGTASGTVSL